MKTFQNEFMKMVAKLWKHQKHLTCTFYNNELCFNKAVKIKSKTGKKIQQFEILHYLQAKKLACRGLKDADKRYRLLGQRQSRFITHSEEFRMNIIIVALLLPAPEFHGVIQKDLDEYLQIKIAIHEWNSELRKPEYLIMGSQPSHFTLCSRGRHYLYLPYRQLAVCSRERH